MTTREAYVFGWMYGRISAALEGGRERLPAISLAAPRPYSASARAITSASRAHILTGELDDDIRLAMDEITSVEPPMDGGSESVQPMDRQSSWQLGYFAGFGGRPLQRVRPESLQAARKAAGLTQAALAEKAGVNIRQIQKLESGEAAPGNMTARNLLSIADALGVDVRDLIG